MVCHDLERGVTAREFSTDWTGGGTDHLCSEALLRLELLVIQFELDPQIDCQGDIPSLSIGGDLAIPIRCVEEHVFAEVFRHDEAVVPVLREELDFAQPSLLDAEPFLDDRVFVGWVHGSNFPCE
mgnify:CR=1 FL=1